jgi:peroxiredoxin
VEEWGLPTEPWTFVLDKEGRVHAKFEQFTPAEEIEAALLEVL